MAAHGQSGSTTLPLMRSEERPARGLPRRLVLLSTIAALVVLVAGTTLMIVKTDYVASTLIVAGLALYLVFALVRSVEAGERQIASFLSAIRMQDGSLVSTARPGRHVSRELADSLQQLFQVAYQGRAERERRIAYLESVVSDIRTGLIAIEAGGSLLVINRAARELLGVADATHLDQLSNLDPALRDAIIKLAPGQCRTVPVNVGQRRALLIVEATHIVAGTLPCRVLSLRDIRSELQRAEFEAWHDLLRVLAHEIRNSVTPITSLATTAADMVRESVGDDVAAGGDIKLALETIARRSEGLLRFVERFNALTSIGTPNRAQVNVAALFGHVEQLLKPALQKAGINLVHQVLPESLTVDADRHQLEQVLINLVLNSLEALERTSEPRIELIGRRARAGGVSLSCRDNGCGIAQEAADRVTLPYYSTKQRNSGIGLAITRQVAVGHDGDLYLESRVGEGTTVTLSLP